MTFSAICDGAKYKREKLLAAIRNNPQAVRFNDACKAAEMVGFTETGGRGSHTVYTNVSSTFQ